MSSEDSTLSIPQTRSVKSFNLSIPSSKTTNSQLWFIRLGKYFLANCNNLKQYNLGHSNTLFLDEVAYRTREVSVKLDLERPYDSLKQVAIKSGSLIDQQAVDQILNQVQMGERIHSQLKNLCEKLTRRQESRQQPIVSTVAPSAPGE
ncbi:unnamed protein product [Schistosoma curassoni]|uniref:Uncharacterized protein n=1 Tax=Schistosoma curassoni TaxID=6186 RepID=A0A183JKM4_9TREM|nr:unnamed protein product [Schistosoma curassoni]